MRNTWVSLTKKLLMVTGIVSMLLMSSPATAQDGEALYKGNCTACHKIDKKVIGPALQGARANWAERTGSDDAIIAWIKNSQGYMKETGDAYAKQLYEDYNKTVMTPMALSTDEVAAILDYVDNWQPETPVAATTAEGGGAASAPESTGNPTIWLIVIIAVLFVVFRVLWGVNKSLTNLNRQKDNDEPAPSVDMFTEFIGFFTKNKAVMVVVFLLIATYVGVLTWDMLNGVGVYQGYQPKQPIWFSHKIHAGQNGINCVYCHNSVEKGKSAGIPSVNICMNCHMGVQEGKVSGTKEIAKIYDAIGWDPDKLQYTEGYDQKPIEWVRIHNLQDFVYFNHSQHVVVGKQECQTCHGPIEEMDEVYQYSELTMGWCINCHRETNVSMDNNGYYESIHAELVEKYKGEGLETFTVEHIGGLECVKCHY